MMTVTYFTSEQYVGLSASWLFARRGVPTAGVLKSFQVVFSHKNEIRKLLDGGDFLARHILFSLPDGRPKEPPN